MRKICRQHFDLENFYSHINKKDNGFFGWNKLRYFLFEYEESLIPKSQGEKIGWKNFTKPYQKEHETIEHILPQTPNEDWKRILNNTDG